MLSTCILLLLSQGVWKILHNRTYRFKQDWEPGWQVWGRMGLSVWPCVLCPTPYNNQVTLNLLFSHFTDEETEAQGGLKTCPLSQASTWQSQDLNPAHLNLWFMILTFSHALFIHSFIQLWDWNPGPLTTDPHAQPGMLIKDCRAVTDVARW
jgi:hypothetical protein